MKLLLVLQTLALAAFGAGAFVLAPSGRATVWRHGTTTRARTIIDLSSPSPLQAGGRPTLRNNNRASTMRVLRMGDASINDEMAPEHKVRTLQTMFKTAYLFALWYILSIYYNIFSKKALLMAPKLAWTTASLQMCGGLALYAWPCQWLGLRPKPPQVDLSDLGRRLAPVALLHSMVHIGGVISMGAGAVSFTYIVKASEPAISAVLSAMTGLWLPVRVYLTLIPIIAGVAMVSVSELTFAWKAFNYAMLSSVASASRAIVGKQQIDKEMTPRNLYQILTIFSSVLLIPLALIMEGRTWMTSFEGLLASRQLAAWTRFNLLSALFYYTYNEVSFLCLDRVSAVSHTIANTFKRVFIIVSSMLVFGNRMTMQGYLGTVLAVGGVSWYSMEKTKYSKAKKE